MHYANISSFQIILEPQSKILYFLYNKYVVLVKNKGNLEKQNVKEANKVLEKKINQRIKGNKNTKKAAIGNSEYSEFLSELDIY